MWICRLSTQGPMATRKDEPGRADRRAAMARWRSSGRGRAPERLNPAPPMPPPTADRPRLPLRAVAGWNDNAAILAGWPFLDLRRQLIGLRTWPLESGRGLDVLSPLILLDADEAACSASRCRLSRCDEKILPLPSFALDVLCRLAYSEQLQLDLLVGNQVAWSYISSSQLIRESCPFLEVPSACRPYAWTFNSVRTQFYHQLAFFCRSHLIPEAIAGRDDTSGEKGHGRR